MAIRALKVKVTEGRARTTWEAHLEAIFPQCLQLLSLGWTQSLHRKCLRECTTRAAQATIRTQASNLEAVTRTSLNKLSSHHNISSLLYHSNSNNPSNTSFPRYPRSPSNINTARAISIQYVQRQLLCHSYPQQLHMMIARVVLPPIPMPQLLNQGQSRQILECRGGSPLAQRHLRLQQENLAGCQAFHLVRTHMIC